MPLQDFDSFMAGRKAVPDFDEFMASRSQEPPESLAEKLRPKGSPGWRAIKGAWKQLNPLNIVEMGKQIYEDPIGVGKGIVDAQTTQAVRAYDAIKQGNVSEAGFRGLAAAVPVLGPMGQDIVDRGQESGDIAGMVGEGVGLLSAPKVYSKAPKMLGKAILNPTTAGVVTTGAGIAAGFDPLSSLLAGGSVRKALIEGLKKKTGWSGAKVEGVLRKMPPEEIKAVATQIQPKLGPKTTGPTKPMTKLEERLQRGRDIAANQRAMRGNTPEEYPVQVGDQNNPNALPEMVPELPPYIGRPEAPPDLIETPPQKVYPPADPAAVEAILKRHAVEPGAVDNGPDPLQSQRDAFLMEQAKKWRDETRAQLEMEKAREAESIRSGATEAKLMEMSQKAKAKAEAAKIKNKPLQLLNEPPEPPPTAPQLPQELPEWTPPPSGPAVAPPQAMEAPMPQGYVPPVDPVMNPQRPTTGPPTEAVYSKLRDHPGYQALVAKIKGMSTPEAIQALLDEKVQDWLIAPTIEAAGGARPSPLMVRSAVNAAKDAAYDARVATLPKSDVVHAPPAFPGQQRAPFVKGATIPGAEDRLSYLQRTAKERGDAPAAIPKKISKNKTLGSDLKAALESPEAPKPPAKPPAVESKIPEFTVAQKFKAEAESKGIQTPNEKYEVTRVSDAEYAKASANPDYVPMEETVGRITAPTEKHALQAVKDLQRRGELPAGNLDLMTPGTKPFIDVESTATQPIAKPPAEALAKLKKTRKPRNKK